MADKFYKFLGTVLLMCFVCEILTIVFKLIQPDCTGRLLGLLLIPINCLVMRFLIYVFFEMKGGDDDSDVH